MTSYGFRDGKIVSKKEINLGKRPVQYVIPYTVAYSTGAIISSWNTHTSTAAKTNTTILKKMPYPMPIVVYPLAAGTAAHADYIKIKGYDSRGIYREEKVAVAGTAGTVQYSNYAYSKITSLKPSPAYSPEPRSTSVSIGYRPVQIGLPYKIDVAADIISQCYGSTAATTAWTVDAYNKVTMATTAVAKVVNITYLSKLQK